MGGLGSVAGIEAIRLSGRCVVHTGHPGLNGWCER